MIAKSIDAITLIFSGIIFIILGICLFFIPQVALKILLLLFGGMTILSGVFSLLKCFFDKKKKPISVPLTASFRDLGIGIFICCMTDFILHSFAVCFGFYLLLHTIINAIQYFIYRKNKIKGRLRIILNILFLLFFLIPLLFDLEQNVQVTSVILGIYLIGYGLTYITDFLTVIIPKKTSNKVKKQIQIPLPVFINAFIPRHLITLVNEMLEVEEETFDYQKRKETPDIFVFIHLAKKGSAAMGHVEIGFQNRIYSYGNYDLHSRKLFDTLGDGIILVADQEKYIRYMVTQKDRYILAFGVTLTKREKEIVKEQINRLVYTDTEPFYPDVALAQKKLLPSGSYQDMSSELYQYADGEFYKIKKGKYKKFFVLKTNCAMVANYVLSSIGKQILCVNGIITPGAYYDYLNARFKLKNTNVISRKIYTKKDFKKNSPNITR